MICCLSFSILSPSSGPMSVVGGENSVSGRDGTLKPKLSHVKKPLNAFMLYMKDMRSKVVSECTLKESAAINQILGKRVIIKLYFLKTWKPLRKLCWVRQEPKTRKAGPAPLSGSFTNITLGSNIGKKENDSTKFITF